MNISFLHLSVIIFQHHILHESLHHHAYAFNILFVLQTAYLFHVRSRMILAFSSAKLKRKHENSWCILSCIYLVPWANHVGIINPFLKLKKKKNTNNKTKWLNMVPNAWLTEKGCFFGHLKSHNYIFHALHAYSRVFHPYDLLMRYWRSKFPFPGLWGWTKLVLLWKGSSSQVEVWK